MIRAFHVSCSPNLTRIDPHLCNDPRRDDLLYGAPVVCFSTTTEFPDTSPYPRRFVEGEVAYRYTFDFDPNDYVKFKMAHSIAHKSQVHFLLLFKFSDQERQVAEFITKYAPKAGNLSMWSACFPNGQPNDYRDHSPELGGQVFVNVMFWHSVPVQFDRTIEKRGPTFTYKPVDASIRPLWLTMLLEEQRRQQVVRALDEKARALEASRVRAQEAMARHQRALEAERQKTESKSSAPRVTPESARLPVDTVTATAAPQTSEVTAPTVNQSVAAPSSPEMQSLEDATEVLKHGLESKEATADPDLPDLEAALSSLEL